MKIDWRRPLLTAAVVIPATALTAAVPMAENQILRFEPAARLHQRR